MDVGMYVGALVDNDDPGHEPHDPERTEHVEHALPTKPVHQVAFTKLMFTAN